MRLFDDIERSDSSPGMRTEGAFEILNRSAQPEVACVREAMERWFNSYPTEGRAELERRFRGGGQRGFESAFYELFLHELVQRLGCTLELHPQLPSSSKHPDFTVTSPNFGSAYLEAVVASEFSDKDLGAERAEDNLLDGLDRLEMEHFFIGIVVQKQGPKPISSRKLRSFVNKQLSSINPITIANDLKSRGIEGIQRLKYQDEGWTLELVPMPKSSTAHSSGARLIGVEMSPVMEIDTISSLKTVLKKKGSKYGELDRPYIVAVNAMGMFSDDASMRAALFGTERVSFDAAAGELEVANRYSEGFWAGNGGPQYTRVSGVLHTRRLDPGNLLIGATATLYLNPWALRPYSGELTQLPTAVQDGSELKLSKGRNVIEVLGLQS